MRENILKKESLIILVLVIKSVINLFYDYYEEIIFWDYARKAILIVLLILLIIDLKGNLKKFKEKTTSTSRQNILTLTLLVEVIFYLIYTYISNLIFLKYIHLVLLSIGLIFCLKKKD